MEASGDYVTRQTINRTAVRLKRGDTLFSSLTGAGVSSAEAYSYIAKLNGQIDIHRLQPGDVFTLAFVTEGDRKRFASLIWSGKRDGTLRMVFLPDVGKPRGLPDDASAVLKMMLARNGLALMRVLTEFGLKPQICEQLTVALSQIGRQPDYGEIVATVYQMPVKAATGPDPRLHDAPSIARVGKQHVKHYMPLDKSGPAQQNDLTPALFVTLVRPLPGARISSPFGWRLHPVLHTVLFHKGVDYEAPFGTPVIAAADGFVEDVGFLGSYGNYIRLRHSIRLETAYAHLSGFAPTVIVGAQVHRGDIIGYVGMTGIATGPHLYFELLVDGRQIDPECKALKQALEQRKAQTAGMP